MQTPSRSKVLSPAFILLTAVGAAAHAEAVTTPIGADSGATLAYASAGTSSTIGWDPTQTVTADFNGDGKPDVAVVDFGFNAGPGTPTANSNSIAFFINGTPKGGTTMTSVSQVLLLEQQAPFNVAVADINGDGKPDLVVSYSPDAESCLGHSCAAVISVLLNDTPAGASTLSFVETDIAPQPSGANSIVSGGVVVGDFNGDGIPDIAFINNILTPDDGDRTSRFLTNQVTILPNTTATGAMTATFDAPQQVKVSPVANSYQLDEKTGSAYTVAAADINGDGKLDLVVGNIVSATVSVMLNTGTSGKISFAAPVLFTAGNGSANGPRSITIGDFNGDGKPDIATANDGLGDVGNTVTVFLNTTTKGARKPTLAAPLTLTDGFPTSILAADVNGDGVPDLIVSNDAPGYPSVNGSIDVYLDTTAKNAKTASFVKAVSEVVSVPEGVAVADLNGDGVPDIVSMSMTEGTLQFLFGAPSNATK
jgi:elongation factor P hydroxylase